MTENEDDLPEARPSVLLEEPDAHGQAALLLSESILHAMLELNMLTLDQAISVVRTTCEVKVDVAEDTHETQGRMRQSLELLAAIERSLTTDRGDRSTVHVLPI